MQQVPGVSKQALTSKIWLDLSDLQLNLSGNGDSNYPRHMAIAAYGVCVSEGPNN